MDTRLIDAILDILGAEEPDQAPHWINVFEHWNMSADDAEEWRGGSRRGGRSITWNPPGHS